MAEQDSTKEYFTPQEVARLLRISPITVRQWAQRGALRAEVTPGGHRRFLKRDIEAFAGTRGLTLHQTEAEGLRVMVVDDDVQHAAFLRELLGNAPEISEIDVAHDGFDAGILVKSFHPHLILLDLMMPAVDGLTVCRRLKQEPVTAGIRIIAMTGYYTEDCAERLIKAGAETCLAKPLEVKRLFEAIGIQPEWET